MKHERYEEEKPIVSLTASSEKKKRVDEVQMKLQTAIED